MVILVLFSCWLMDDYCGLIYLAVNAPDKVGFDSFAYVMDDITALPFKGLGSVRFFW